MKPIKLQLIEFGAYRNETIDFQSLVAQPIFLITGKTGSGKSTIFNAISFALYNKISTTTKNSHFRSKYADDKVQTKVIFEFELKGDIYKVERTLPYLKTGNKRETPGKAILLKKVNDEFVLLESKDVTKKIEKLVGLSYDEFNQIIVLPQGKFKELLMSDANKKGQILRSLFNTTFYKVFADKLSVVSKDKQNQIKEKEIEFKENIAHFSFSEKLTNYNFVTDEIFVQINEQQNNSEKYLQKVSEQLESKQQDYKEIDDNYRKLEQLNDNFLELDRNLENKNNLEKHKEEMENLEKEITKLELVKTNEFIITNYNKNSIKLAEEKSNLENYSKERSKLLSLVEQRENDLRILEKNRNKIEESKQYLSDNNYFYKNIADYDEAFVNEKKYSEKLIQLEKIASNKKEIEENLLKYQKEREVLAEEQEQLTKSVLVLNDELSLLKEQRVALNQFNDKKKKLNDSEKRLIILKDELKKANEQLVLAKDSYAKIEKSIKENYLSNLAANLHVGDNCPLCQAKIEHLPNFSHIEVTDKEAKDKREDVENKTIAVSKLEQQKISIQEEIEQLENQLREEKSSINLSVEEQLNEVVSEKKDKEKQIENNKNKVADIKEQILACENSIVSFNKKLVEQKEIEESLTKAKVRVQEIAEKLENVSLEQFAKMYSDKEKEVAEFEKKVIEVKENIVELEKDKIELNQKLTTSENEIFNLKQSIVEFEDELLKQQIYNYYTNIEEITLSLNELSQLDSYKEQLEIYNKDYVKVTENIEKLQQKLQEKERPNLEEAQENKENYRKEIDGIIDRRAKLKANFDKDKKLLKKMKVLASEYVDLESEYGEISKLTEMIVKGGDSKISLERYVQGYYLDLILGAASDRLMKMTHSRYSLERSDEKQGNSNAGLDIKVFDSHQNGARNIATLSGGELFLASLSLALGLAEVIQSSNGTISLETIFIDEGFGSLDSETLDMAITTLIDLQSYGRNIGIISHVSELKERVSAKLEIINSDNGAKTKIRGI